MNDATKSFVTLPFTPSSALDINQDRALEHLERATPVRLIGTFDKLCTAYHDDPISLAIEKRTLLRKVHDGLEVGTSQIEDELKTIENDLRNPIAHGAEYAASRAAAFQTAKAARLVRDWIAQLRTALTAMPNANAG